MLTLLIKLYIK